MTTARRANAFLFNRLVAHYGAGAVDVSPGANGTEEYTICCPFCRDHRPRLRINSDWGTTSPGERWPDLRFACCHNEDCLSKRANREQLYEWLYMTTRLSRPVSRPVRAAVVAPRPTVCELPGPCWRLDALAKRHPNHPAIKYIESRFFDPEILGKVYGVSYCEESRYGLARDRIIIPIHGYGETAGKLVGWQARYIGDQPEGFETFSQAQLPKYWTVPGYSRTSFPLNFARAVSYQHIALVEGPFDLFSYGTRALALLGKSLSLTVVEALKQHSGLDKPIVVLLDPDQSSDAIAKGKTHHIETAAERLRIAGFRHVVPVYLPAGMDAGSVARGKLHAHVAEQARKQGVMLDFRPKPVIGRPV